MTIPGTRTTIEDDLYAVLVDWESVSVEGATFRVFSNPLVWWLWAGSFIFILGTAVAAWPDRDPEAQRSRIPARAEARQA
jgi:cytochrome c-type biogenesis protein CcmF